MQGIPLEDRRHFGSMLEHCSQHEVMSRIPQFSQTDVCHAEHYNSGEKDQLNVLVFNMERGVHLAELGDFLEYCPEIQPFDVILANELDDGCVRSGCRNTTKELAQRLGMDSVFGLEFIELANENDPKGFHGNAIFSRFPIRDAKIVRMPEEYNWYFDRQKRIGGRLGILAELSLGSRQIGVGTIHLENRTDGGGRDQQLRFLLEAAERQFPKDMPVALGGDLNTNTFDGNDKAAIQKIASSAELQRRCLEDVPEWENCLRTAESFGYTLVPDLPVPTRRKPLPQGGWLPLRLDWLLLRGMKAEVSRVVSTRKEDCAFAPEGSALEKFQGEELSDHNAVWAKCSITW